VADLEVRVRRAPRRRRSVDGSRAAPRLARRLRAGPTELARLAADLERRGPVEDMALRLKVLERARDVLDVVRPRVELRARLLGRLVLLGARLLARLEMREPMRERLLFGWLLAAGPALMFEALEPRRDWLGDDDVLS